jgi:hypothetical protein
VVGPTQALEFARNRDSYPNPCGRSLFMCVSLLNEQQRRRLATHLGLLVSDLDALARAPELGREGAAYAALKDAIAATRRAADAMRAMLGLAPDRAPSFARRVAAVADVWSARIEDLRARRLKAYGPVHADLAPILDPGLDEVLRRLEALGGAARTVPEGEGERDREREREREGESGGTGDV